MKKLLLLLVITASLHADNTKAITDELNRGFSYIGVLLIVLIASVWAIFFLSNRSR